MTSSSTTEAGHSKSPYYRHLDACGRCRRARGTLQLCDTGANLFRQEKERTASTSEGEPEAWVELDDCPNHPMDCRCEPPCAICGFNKHVQLHTQEHPFTVLDSEREAPIHRAETPAEQHAFIPREDSSICDARTELHNGSDRCEQLRSAPCHAASDPAATRGEHYSVPTDDGHCGFRDCSLSALDHPETPRHNLPIDASAATGEGEGEKSLTVEAALDELRAMWPDGSFKIIISSGLPRYMIMVLRKPHLSVHRPICEGATLLDAIQEIREWRITYEQ